MYVEYLPNEKHPKRGAEISDDLTAFEDAGYLLEDDDLIFDIDHVDKQVIEAMLNFFSIKTQVVWTDRGAHIYFKKPMGFKGAKGLNGLGFEAEYKHIANTKSITVKRNGVARKIDNEGLRANFPKYLEINRKVDVLYGLDDGDGRNNALFKHRNLIKNIKEWKQCLTFINDYIFATPLPKDELELLLRDDVKNNDEQEPEAMVADMIMNEKKVVRYAHHTYFKEGNEYKADDEELRRITFKYAPGLKTRFVDEVIKQMEYRAKPIDENQVFDIKLKNGILREGKFIKIEYDEFTPFSIDIAYDPDTKRIELVDQYLDMLTDNDENYKKHILEVLGHTLIVNKEVKRLLGKFFIFIGDGGNGKGTLLAIIREILSVKNCGSLSINNMTDERYLNSLQGKLTNLGDDVQDEPINNEQMKMLKNISTCDFISLRKLYADSVSTELTPTLIFTSNHILSSFEKGTSYKRRVEWLPMYNKPKKKSGTFISEVTSPEALKYWIKLIVEGYMRLYENKEFTDSKKIDQFNEEYHKNNNTAVSYLEDLTVDDIVNKRSPEVYEPYEIWCEENGVNTQSQKLFKNTLQEQFGVEIRQRKVGNKNQKVFVKVTKTDESNQR
ncbi:phage/plasmid primase, P4 family [Lactobacillus terrae]|uniref:phage/plasmid primase, P4 family n=1 Tax=Lactobacillus terrae TaxID=2269374 RepID=UPI000C1B66B9|nr:phage/plasmid primase, P4 family [Lactobacillus terrae]